MTRSQLELAILEWLEPRTSGYARPEIQAAERVDIDAVVDTLRRAGLVEAAFVKAHFGDNPAHWAPSKLTAGGRSHLAELRAKQ